MKFIITYIDKTVEYPGDAGIATKGEWRKSINIEWGSDFTIERCKDLETFFNGNAYINPVTLDWCEGETSTDAYKHIKRARWYGETGFEKYVAKWLNSHQSVEMYRDLCEGRIAGSSERAMKILRKYRADLNNRINELVDGIGGLEGFWSIFFKDSKKSYKYPFGTIYFNSDFSFERLVHICFEDGVREALVMLNIEDI